MSRSRPLKLLSRSATSKDRLLALATLRVARAVRHHISTNMLNNPRNMNWERTRNWILYSCSSIRQKRNLSYPIYRRRRKPLVRIWPVERTNIIREAPPTWTCMSTLFIVQNPRSQHLTGTSKKRRGPNMSRACWKGWILCLIFWLIVWVSISAKVHIKLWMCYNRSKNLWSRLTVSTKSMNFSWKILES